MVKKIMKKKAQVAKKPKQAVVKAARAGRVLDGPARAYAMLLSDPCMAPLTHPLYAGGEGGILVKAESVFNLVGGGTDTKGLVHWTPGAIGTTNSELLTDSSNGTFTATANANTPGKTFLVANATGVRCVAACLQATYLGTELNRAGNYALGRTQGSLIDLGSAINFADLEPTLEHFTRTPDGTIELRWIPANMDQSFTDPNVATPAQEKDRKSAITFSASGLTAGSGIRFRLVAIYEYQPKTGTGIATPSSSRAKSSFSLDDVLNVVETVTNVISKVNNVVGSAYMRGPALMGR